MRPPVAITVDVVVRMIDETGPQRHDEGQPRGHEALEATWGAGAQNLAHQQPEIEAAGMNQEPLQDVVVPTQMRATQAAGLVQMGVRAFEALTAAPLKRSSFGP